MRYAKYKPTNIPWLPEVPKGWEVRRGKYLLIQKLESCQRGVKVGLENIESCSGKYFPTASSFEGGGVAFEPGDILYGKLRPYLAKAWLAEFTGNAVGDFYVYSPAEAFDGRYALYWLLSKPFTDVCTVSAYGAKMPRVSSHFISSLSFPLPPLPTQRAIVAFLDGKCGKIDRWVAAKEREVALLKELKQAMIAEAVTGATNVARNDTARKMKPSGIPWLPEVPEGWEWRKMKYLFSERSDKGHPEETPLCSTQAHGVIPQSLYENRVVVVNKDGLGLLKLVKVGDFVISLRSFQGGIEIAHYQGIISAAYTILEPRDSRNSAYFRYLFKSHAFIGLLQTCVTGIREGQNINYPLLSRKFLPVPPLSEQRAIVAYIEERAAKIDAAVAGLEREVAAMKEYKQRLIADVVTGQRKVA